VTVSVILRSLNCEQEKLQMLEIGSVIDGKYKILNKIGQGGMSVVYLAMNERANKQWAIKEVRKDGVTNFEVVKQGLVAEVDMLKKLNHPHLPSIIDVIDGDDSFLIVMDYIEGVSLNKKLRELGAIPQENVIEWGKQLCDVLGYLHSRTAPIIYRDMKPANVMLRPDGDVMLIDFGTAREFKSNSVADTTCLGTQGYAAPEQFGGQGQTDARTDIYCLGATLYHLVTGHNPCEYPYEMYPIRQWNPALSSGLEQIIQKCTQKNPNDRYQSCAELMYALDHYQDFDIESRKKMNVKWRSFVAASLASIVMFGGAVGFKIKANSDSERAFNNNITHTETIEDFRNLVVAASAFPERVEPYKKAVEIILRDSQFTTTERNALLTSLLDPSDTENIDTLKEENNEYYKFCYDLGIAYFFQYENYTTGIANCQKWLDEAAKSPEYESTINDTDYGMSAEDIKNAKMLSKLSGAVAHQMSKNNNVSIDSSTNIVNVGEEGPTGDTEYNEKQYWDDLTSILKLEFFNESNSMTKRRVYQWIHAALQHNHVKMAGYGVTYSQMREVIDKAKSDLNSILIGIADTSSASYQEVKSLLDNYETIADMWADQ